MEALERDASVLFPGAVEAIQRAAAAVPIAIASGALGAEIRRVLDGANLTHHFAAIVAAEDTAAGKPAPDPYQRAVALLSTAMDMDGLAPATAWRSRIRAGASRRPARPGFARSA